VHVRAGEGQRLYDLLYEDNLVGEGRPCKRVMKMEMVSPGSCVPSE
jgi:hypothetical protein